MAANDELELRYTNMCGGSSSVTDFSSKANMVQAAFPSHSDTGWPGMAGDGWGHVLKADAIEILYAQCSKNG